MTRKVIYTAVILVAAAGIGRGQLSSLLGWNDGGATPNGGITADGKGVTAGSGPNGI